MIAFIGSQLVSFTTIFLGIFIEAVPFLLLGTISSGLIEVFISRDQLLKTIPRSLAVATLIGVLLGFAFPVGEGGVIPLTRRLLRKGLPIPAGIAFLIAGPILNPVVLATTLAAYGWGSILWARLGLGSVIAFAVGLVFSRYPTNVSVIRESAGPPTSAGDHDEIALLRPDSLRRSVRIALRIAGDEFFEIGRFLILGALLAALIQTFVPLNAILSVGSGPLSSVLVMQAAGFLLSVSSAFDAHVSVTFVPAFPTGSILSFLVFGAMADLKSTSMLLGVFRLRVAGYLVLLTFLMTLLMGVFVNLNVAW